MGLDGRLSLSARRAWIEIASCWRVSGRTLSLSARRAWIEICSLRQFGRAFWVALRKESVDRNWWLRCWQLAARDVALRKESVDRNKILPKEFNRAPPSLSARRAWIEIVDYVIDYVNDAVALRKESVDRNRSSIKRCLMSVGRSPQGERG